MAKIALVNVFEFGDIAAVRASRGSLQVRASTAPPLGLLALAAVLRQRGHDVQLVDWRKPILAGELALDDHLCREAALHVRRLGADVVGFTSRCDTYGHTLATMRHYRQADPNAVLVLGGPQATITASETLTQFPFVDLVVRYEGEVTFPALVEAISDGTPYAELPGLAYRGERGLVVTPEPAAVSDLDTLPMPAYDLHPPEMGEAYVEVGRGCPFGCSFCSTTTFFRRNYRMKSPERILGEVRMLASRYGTHNFHFIHDMFTADCRRVLAICNGLQRAGLGVVWGCSARLDCLSPALLEAMHAAGCRRIFLGIESGSPRVQQLVNKRLDLRRLAPLLEHCRQLGIRIRASFIVGFPDETLEDLEMTLRTGLSCACLGADSSVFHLLSPYPGTPLTIENASRLVLTGYGNDMSSTEGPPDAEVDGYVRAYPAIFSNHYQVVPRHHPLEAILGLDVFGLPLNFLRHALGAMVKERDGETLYELFRRTQPDLRAVERERSRVERIRLAIAIVADHMNAHILASGGALPRTREALRYDLAMAVLGFAPPPCPADQRSGAARDLVLRLAGPCVLLDTWCDIDELLRWLAENDRPVPPLAAPTSSTVLYWTVSPVGDPRVGWVKLSGRDRRLLDDCTGQHSLGAIASRAWHRGDERPAGDHEAAAAVVRRIMELRQLGLVALDPRGQGAVGPSPRALTLPGAEREWTAFSAMALLRPGAVAREPAA